ncbi:MAG: VanZ family protein [Porphyromonadaceae bacterium]|nr:VanZ family protein [Porphyromonadaceae bacterium]
MALAARILLIPYLVSLFLITWLPGSEAERVTGIVAYTAHALERWSIPFAVGYPALEFTANIVLFLPFGLFLRLAWPQLTLLVVSLSSSAVSVLIETVQVLLPTRYPTVSDVIANTSGGIIGYGLAIGAVALVRRYAAVNR